MLLGDVFEQRGEADAAAEDLQEALACSSLLAPLMPALARLIVDDSGTSQINALANASQVVAQKGIGRAMEQALLQCLLISPEYWQCRRMLCCHEENSTYTIRSGLLECAWALA